MYKFLPVLFFIITVSTAAQSGSKQYMLSVSIANEKQQPLEAALVQLFTQGNKLVKSVFTDGVGKATFLMLDAGEYYVAVRHTGYRDDTSSLFKVPVVGNMLPSIQLQLLSNDLQNITVSSKKPFIQRMQGKVVVNVDASVTNAGTTVLEVLEKSPGIMVDRNGSISMNGKASVLVLIDDKPTYLSGTDLSNMLSGMNSSQVESIELIANPSAKYDASGNAGIINIKTKRSKQVGFNGTYTFSFGQGRYPKLNNNISLNYKKNKLNAFAVFSSNYNRQFSSLDAFRDYFATNGSISNSLIQPTYFLKENSSNLLRLGADYAVSPKTVLGIAASGSMVNKDGTNDALAIWKGSSGNVDSSIATNGSSNYQLKSFTSNFNLRHTINKQQGLSVDVDFLGYSITNDQYFNSKLQQTGGYNIASQGSIPAAMNIVTAKADYTSRFGKNSKLEAGAKTASTQTDNKATYLFNDGNSWQPDLGKSNHFLYNEYIHAAYANMEHKHKKLSMQFGLRYEFTNYHAKQLGNTVVKDSSFSNRYDGLFPSASMEWQMDSSNTFSFTTGRRIDRPAFQKLNPFTFIINKYTYQTGNPYFLPQYSWNMEVAHQYKQWLTTTVSYAIIKNYFSQLFFANGDGIMFYSEGNVGSMHNLGISASVQSAITKWWSLNTTALYNYKQLKGMLGNNYASSVSRMNFNINNQFSLGKGINAELSGVYTTRARNDLQELLYPTGQVAVGISMPVLKKKGTLKLSFRDIFFTNVMEGVTDFGKVSEYFIMKWDTRVANISFVYRFGKQFKTMKRSNGGATDEMQRAGS